MKILVTGGVGFVGTNLIKRLLKEGHEVQSLDDYSTGLKSNEIDGCRYWAGDIQSISTMDKDFDVVFHMAAIARIQPSFERPEDYIETNFNGTYEVVKFCIKNNISLIYAGSSSKHSGRFKNPYTFSKDLGEDIVTLYQTHFGLKAAIARFYNVYGPHQLLEGGYTTLIGKWINNIQNGIQCVIYGDGELKDKIQQRICEERLPVELLPFEKDVYRVLANVDILVMTSDNEGTPLTVMEASYAGVPCIGTNVGSMRDIVKDGVNGFLVDPTAASLAIVLQELLENRQELTRLILGASKYAEDNFNIRNYVHGHEKLYQGLVDSAN
jgi:UDP-glucose 4-epimerase